ncbi:GAF domain-containing protein [Streptomyces sp. NPDC006553]|uniref:GAF domain-containing protein n=1 Tax=unclassified Streptomyces TaxID=2593676 RepID=UPI002257A332|nr:GAF domain-containing protein [Streptomyces sp. NBC_00233]MCX5232521.1 GAF domain-containing protein [Streptomyces sp. NBC_00233]
MDPQTSGEARRQRLQALGLNSADAEATFDRVAKVAATVTGAPLAMVNFINDQTQMFRGMYVPRAPDASPDEPTSADAGITFDLSNSVAREAPGDYGFCPHVVAQGAQLALDDVLDYPRFAGNPLVNDMGVRSYLGTPLRDNTGMILGTLCVADTSPRTWDPQTKELMHDLAQTLVSEFRLRDSLLAQQQELFAVFDGAPFPIMLTEGPRHLMRYANGRQAVVFGMGRQYLPGPSELPSLRNAGVFDAMDSAFHSGQPVTHRASVPTADHVGYQEFDFLCTPVRTSPGAPISGILTVAMNASTVSDPHAFSVNVQQQFERLGAGGGPAPFPGQPG